MRVTLGDTMTLLPSRMRTRLPRGNCRVREHSRVPGEVSALTQAIAPPLPRASGAAPVAGCFSHCATSMGRWAQALAHGVALPCTSRASAPLDRHERTPPLLRLARGLAL
jgi:hypothetical protein